MNPLEQLKTWFESTPPEFQRELATLAAVYGSGGVVAGVDINSSTHELERAFLKAMTPAAEATPMASVGTTLALASLIDFAFLNRSTKEAWAEVVAMNEHATEYARQRGTASLLATIEREALGVPLRAAMWIREAARWRELSNSALAPRALDSWLKSELDRLSREQLASLRK